MLRLKFVAGLQVTSLRTQGTFGNPCTLKPVTHQIFTSFHFPFLNITNDANAIAVSATGIAVNTPVGPH